MTDPIDPRLEGRLLALRHILAQIAAGQTGDALLERLLSAQADGQEDPGAVPTEAFALDGALAEEKRQFVRELERRMGNS